MPSWNGHYAAMLKHYIARQKRAQPEYKDLKKKLRNFIHIFHIINYFIVIPRGMGDFPE